MTASDKPNMAFRIAFWEMQAGIERGNAEIAEARVRALEAERDALKANLRAEYEAHAIVSTRLLEVVTDLAAARDELAIARELLSGWLSGHRWQWSGIVGCEDAYCEEVEKFLDQPPGGRESGEAAGPHAQGQADVGTVRAAANPPGLSDDMGPRERRLRRRSVENQEC